MRGLLDDRPIHHVRWGLERIAAILDEVGRPERSFRSIHLAGTNGKGSAAAAAYAVLEAAGRRAGLYTSPHLVTPEERVRATGGVPAALLDRCADRVRSPADACGATYFEAVTAVALLAFAELGVEWAALETGLGGRLDATNAVMPAACAIVTVAMDHAAVLGSSLEAIAREKAGILKPAVPAALGRLASGARRAVVRRAREVRAPLLELGRHAEVEEVEVSMRGTRFRYRSAGRPEGMSLRTSLVGAHQADNAAVALLALEAAGALPDGAAVARGVAATRLPGRFQVVRDPRGTWVLDMAHNAAAAAALRRTLDEVRPPEPLAFVVGILADKDWPGILAALLRPGDAAVLTVPPSAPAPRRWDPAEAEAGGPAERRAVADFGEALRQGRELAGDGTVVVTGSAYTVGDALVRLRETGVHDGGAPARAPDEPTERA